MKELDDRDRARVEALADAQPFRITVEVHRHETGYAAEARWGEDEAPIARCDAPDAVAAFEGAARACGQVLGRMELSARFSMLGQQLEDPEG